MLDLSRRLEDPGAAFQGRTPWWGGDLQTLRNYCLPQKAPLPGQSWAIEFPMSDGSGDRLTGTLHRPADPARKDPLILLVHGLTGCEDSSYVRESTFFHIGRGRSVLRLNLRGAGTSRCVANGYYHAGCANDIRDVVDGLDDALSERGLFLVGFSLGGNILLNLVGRLERRRGIVGIATVSAPIEPFEACERMMEPRNAIYHRFLLRRMKQDVLSSSALSKSERENIERAESIFGFDECWVAPQNGFRDARDYYEQTAGVQFVRSISVPTLMLHASNDPWIPVRPYLSLKKFDLPKVEIIISRSGGHVGFHESGYAETWHDRTIDTFIRNLVGSGSIAG